MQNNAEKKHFIISGHSGPAGVLFACEDQAAFAHRGKDGRLLVVTGPEKDVQKKMEQAEKNFPKTWYALLFAALFLLIAVLHLVFAVKHGWTGWQIAGAVVFWLPGWWVLTCICSFLTPIYKNRQDLQHFKRYHGAEHKVYNAHRKMNEAPDVQQAMPYSRLAPACGCAYSGAELFCLALGGTLIACAPRLGLLKIVLISLVTGIFVIMALGGYLPFPHPFILLELAATAEPGTEEVEVACAAMRALYNNLEKENGGEKNETV